jgi:hypothetical protein
MSPPSTHLPTAEDQDGAKEPPLRSVCLCESRTIDPV